MNEKRARDPSWLRQVRQGNIVIHNHHLDFDAKRTGAFSGESEIQSVAGVVLYYQQTPRLTRNRKNACQHRISLVI